MFILFILLKYKLKYKLVYILVNSLAYVYIYLYTTSAWKCKGQLTYIVRRVAKRQQIFSKKITISLRMISRGSWFDFTKNDNDIFVLIYSDCLIYIQISPIWMELYANSFLLFAIKQTIYFLYIMVVSVTFSFSHTLAWATINYSQKQDQDLDVNS